MPNIPIFLTSDENYAPYLTVTAYSILNNTNSFIEFYILDGGISEKSKQLIKSSLDNFQNFSVNFIDMQAYDLNRFPNLKHYSVNTFARFFIPEIFPEAGKIIYLDVDTVVKNDIADLYNAQMDGFPLAAILEDYCAFNAEYLKKEIYPEYKGGTKYFNAGVLLMDIQKFIQNNYSQKLIDTAIKYMDKLSTADQDVFNIVFENNFKILDYKYNFMPDYFEALKRLYPDSAESIKENAYVVHYTWYKPWKTILTEAFNEFWTIAERTLFYERIKQNYLSSQYDLIKKVFLFGFIPLPRFKFWVKLFINKFGLIGYKRVSKIKSKFYLFGLPLIKVVLNNS